ncbi:hypothetical protein H7F15_11605 [Pontibacter sp. Tf4]|uniref:hypothetical protein n=1 Tax=Pontibacter sp. Tf4 TaxID=2761620 RepID=UPI0016235972|nr:hypothetical protein [Pontibacter sp. Tf4]MBB6611686.1 hypothetical protein [Pontibacter sp. Tf4]
MNEAVRTNSFKGKDKTLLINGELIRFNDKEIERRKVSGIRYWISAIEFYKFTVGRKYHIGLRTENVQIDIIFKSYFGFGNAYFTDLCGRIVDEIWESIISQIMNPAVDLLIAGEEVQFGHCTLSKDGVLITKNNTITKKQSLVSWADLNYQKNYDRLTLNSKSDHKLWTNLYFRESWNIEILMALLDWITMEDGLKEIHKKENNSNQHGT